jgi:hypothetical protein
MSCGDDTVVTTSDGATPTVVVSVTPGPSASIATPIPSVADGSAGPPLGHYECYQGGTSYFGWVELEAGGNYTPFSGAAGQYTYDPASSLMTFTTGNFAEDGWTGLYPVPEDEADVFFLDPSDLKIRCHQT